MNIFEERFYAINRFLLSLIGLWPYMDRRKMFIRTIFVQVGILCAIVIETLRLILLRSRLDLVIENLTYLTGCILITVLYFAIFFHKRADQIKLYESINYEWHKVESEEEYKILQKFAARTRIFMIVIIVTLYIHIGLSIPGSIYPLILDVINPLNKTRQMKFLPLLEYFSGRERYILKILFIYYLTMIAIGITAASTIGFLIVCVQHACSMFALTGYVMRYSLKEQPDSRLDLDFYDESNKAYTRIIRATKCHKRAIHFVDQVNSVFSKCNFLIYSMWFSILTFQISQIYSINFIFLTMMIIQLFAIVIICFLCQKIIDYSKEVFENLLMTQWYLAPIKVQKLLLIIMMRSMKPSYLSIGAMFVLSNEFSLTSIRNSVSYAMILYSFQEFEEFEFGNRK